MKTGINVGWFMDLHDRYLRGEITLEQYERAMKEEREARDGN